MNSQLGQTPFTQCPNCSDWAKSNPILTNLSEQFNPIQLFINLIRFNLFGLILSTYMKPNT